MSEACRILIIDDDAMYVKATTAVLESKGYKVDSAMNGSEGIAKMRQHLPDLVLLDVMMDWALEGVAVSNEMMNDRGLRQIPIIMVTSIGSSKERGAFPQDQYLHVDSWLNKPCAPSALLSEVQATLARHARYRER